jgi:hypothetical protein
VKAFEKYWVSYYIVYLVSAVFLLWRHREAIRWDDESYLYLLAAIFGLSVGTALMVAILVEVTGRMVLLIPEAIKKIMEKGREEGRREGLQEGQRELQQQWLAWYERQQAATREGRPFTEPPPGVPQRQNGE